MPEEKDKPRIRLGARLMLVVLLFASFELLLLAVVMKGVWLVLLVPGAVCAHRGFGLWTDIRHKLERHPGH